MSSNDDKSQDDKKSNNETNARSHDAGKAVGGEKSSPAENSSLDNGSSNVKNDTTDVLSKTKKDTIDALSKTKKDKKKSEKSNDTYGDKNEMKIVNKNAAESNGASPNQQRKYEDKLDEEETRTVVKETVSLVANKGSSKSFTPVVDDDYEDDYYRNTTASNKNVASKSEKTSSVIKWSSPVKNVNRTGRTNESKYAKTYQTLDKPKKPVATPGPPTRGGRTTKSRGGERWGLHSRPYGFEEPLFQTVGQERARLVSFYKNGDAYFKGIKVSFRPGRDFVSMDSLYNYLTPRMDLPTGVRYVFTVDGRRVRRLDEFENGESYVCSSRRRFQPLPYGSTQKSWNPHLKFDSHENDLLQAPNPPIRRMNGLRERGGWSPDGPYSNGSVPGSREGRVIKVINNLNHKIQSRILLNLRTSQPWEEVLEDLGQALKMKRAKKLYTISGQEVKSFSQLRNEFKNVETFYLDNGDSRGIIGLHDPRKESSRSLEDQTISRERDNKRGKRPGSAPPVPGERGTYPDKYGEKAVQPLNSRW